VRSHFLFEYDIERAGDCDPLRFATLRKTEPRRKIKSFAVDD
jgi:hypothetical protein